MRGNSFRGSQWHFHHRDGHYRLQFEKFLVFSQCATYVSVIILVYPSVNREDYPGEWKKNMVTFFFSSLTDSHGFILFTMFLFSLWPISLTQITPKILSVTQHSPQTFVSILTWLYPPRHVGQGSYTPLKISTGITLWSPISLTVSLFKNSKSKPMGLLTFQ